MLSMVFAASASATNFGPFSCTTCGNGFDASAFNVVTLGTTTGNAGNFVPNSDIGGGVAVYGNYTGNGYAINQQYSSVPNPYTDQYTMIVNGNISTNGSFSVDGTGAQQVYVGGSYSTSVFNGTKPTVVQPPTASDFDFLAARTSLDNLSSSTLTNYSGATTYTPTSNGTNYVLTASGSGLLVYNVNYQYFDNQNLGFQVNVSSGQSVVINIVGAPATFTFSKGTVIMYNGNQVNANTTGGIPVLFNLPEVTELDTSNGAINGTILAPFADFDSANQDMDGQLIVASVSGLAETHDQHHDGTLPSLSTTTETATPGPATFLLFGSALMAMTVLMRRRMD